MTDLSWRIEVAAPAELRDLRRRILRNNDPHALVVDDRDDDGSSLHVGGYLGERLVVSASFFRSTGPVRPELVTCQLRFMATEFDVQGQGLGAKVLAFAEVELRRRGVEQMWANARDTALGFYRATGWTTVAGSEHLSAATNLAHTVIIKQLLVDGQMTP